MQRNFCFFEINLIFFTFVAVVIKQEPLDQKELISRDWISPVPEVEIGGSGHGGPFVRARKDIPRGARFGPFRGKWASQPFNPRYAWEVSKCLLKLILYVLTVPFREGEKRFIREKDKIGIDLKTGRKTKCNNNWRERRRIHTHARVFL